MRTKALCGLMAVAVVSAACSLADEAERTRETSRAGAEDSSARADTRAPRRVPTAAGRSTPRRVDPRRGGLELGFGEFAITLEADEIRPGPVTFVVRNRGKLVHGFEIKIEDIGDGGGHGRGHSGGGDRFEFEGPTFGPGETLRLPTLLSPGIYEVECFVAEHDDLGMRATLVVRHGAPLSRVERERPSPDSVEIADFSFSPADIEIEAGTEVTWSNADPTPHTVSARDGSFDSETLDSGSEYAATFSRAGTFAYLCQIHPSMRGTIRVVDSP